MRRGVGVGLVGLLLFALPAHALTDEEIFRNFRFNLINPGARSLALGGAFVSLADDATAAQANPAGLAFLVRSEYFGEFRWIDNAAESEILEEQLPAGIETFVAGGTDLDDTFSPSFVSAVTTYTVGEREFAVGLSRQEVLNIRNDTVSSFAFTFPAPGAFFAEGTGAVDVEVANYNLSAGVRVNDRFSVGATWTYSRVDVTSEVTNLIVDTGGNVAGQEILEPELDLRTSINDHDDDLVFSLGLLVKFPERNVDVGGVFRQGAEFALVEEIDEQALGPGTLAPPGGLDIFGVRDRLGSRFRNRLNLPDVYAVGASWKKTSPQGEQNLTLALDVERIRYSSLLDGYVAGVNILTGEDAVFTIDDATDLRLGAEYILPRAKLPILALRAGAFTESDSTIRAVSTGSDAFATPEAFKGRETEFHATIGLGLAMPRFKVDFAADFSDTDNEYLISVIYQGK